MSFEDLKKNYNINQWGGGYFDINQQGQIVVNLGNERNSVCLQDVVSKTSNAGLNLPILVRFPDILRRRMLEVQEAFVSAMTEVNYSGGYQAVYPIKVNQHRSVIETLNNMESTNIGLEAGSKPEFMAILGSVKQQSLIICNGYKDREYIKLALIATALGHKVFIVIEKLTEVPYIAAIAKELKIKPLLGVRVRLATLGVGKWQNSGGEKAKFGLNPQQLLELCTMLKEHNIYSNLKLLHFHMGSQISNIKSIQQGVREGVRFFVELKQMGVDLAYLDIGGGLGVDYEGSRTRSFCSTNYSLQEYAYNVVHSVEECCRETKIKPPIIITEAGRAMTAHHEILIGQVVEKEKCEIHEVKTSCTDDTHKVIKNLYLLLETFSKHSPIELFHNASYWLAETHSLFVNGMLSLKERALAEKLVTTIWQKVLIQLDPKLRAHRAVYDEINKKLVNKLFGNFSIFQSVPDVWAIDQIFPILPINNLDQQDQKRYVIEDITCDSDGCFNYYIDGQGIEESIPLPESIEKEGAIFAIFLVGAYQDTLGDKHNLFGRTHSVDVFYDEQEGFVLQNITLGDTIADILKEVKFDQDELLCSYTKQIEHAKLNNDQKESFLQYLKQAMNEYTYLLD